ncbi:unnamed protein product, partial [Urochloa humidicola]
AEAAAAAYRLQAGSQAPPQAAARVLVSYTPLA